MGTDRTSQQTGERAEAGRMVTPLAGKGTPSQEQVWRGAGLDCAWDRPSMSCLRREGAAVLRSPWEPLGWRCLDGSPPEHGDGDGADREKRVSTREKGRGLTQSTPPWQDVCHVCHLWHMGQCRHLRGISSMFLQSNFTILMTA